MTTRKRDCSAFGCSVARCLFFTSNHKTGARSASELCRRPPAWHQIFTRLLRFSHIAVQGKRLIGYFVGMALLFFLFFLFVFLGITVCWFQRLMTSQLFQLHLDLLSNVYLSASNRKKRKKTIYNKHQNTTNMLDYQAVTHICVAYKINGK